MIGIVKRLPTPQLPLAINQMMLVAHLTDVRTVEKFEIAVSIMTPSGLLTSAAGSGCVVIEIAHDYVLVTLRDIPLNEEGLRSAGRFLSECTD
jgi:hypothetical protein